MVSFTNVNESQLRHRSSNRVVMTTAAVCSWTALAVSCSRRVNVSLRSSVICLDAFGSAARSAHERCRTRACAVTRAYSSCSAQLVLHRRRRVGHAHVLLARRAPLTSLRPRVRYRPCPIRRPRLRSIKSASDQPGAYLHRSAPPPLPPLQLRYRRETGADERTRARRHESTKAPDCSKREELRRRHELFIVVYRASRIATLRGKSNRTPARYCSRVSLAILHSYSRYSTTCLEWGKWNVNRKKPKIN